MKKLIFVSIQLILINIVFAQSKKEQIQSLTFRVDSINAILSSERNVFAQKEQGYTSKISNLENQISLLKSEIELINKKSSNKEVENENLKNELTKRKNEIEILNQRIIIIKDSLFNVIKNTVDYQDANLEKQVCWKNISDYDTVRINNKIRFHTLPINTLEYNSVNSNKTFYNLAERNIESNSSFLKCTFRNGTSKIYKNDYGPKKFDNISNDSYYPELDVHTFIGSLYQIDYYLIQNHFSESGYFLLVDKENGNEFKICSEPIFSSDNKYFVCNIAAADGYGGIDLQIFEINNKGKIKKIDFKYNFKWSPLEVKWNEKNELLIKKSRDLFYLESEPCNPKYTKLIIK